MSKINRREFIKTTTAAAVGSGASLAFAGKDSPFDAKGLPTVSLGKTGVRVPRYALGLGSRFCSVQEEDKGLEILNYALDHGLYYWDTAATYQSGDVVSEERLGKLLKTRRKEVFLATKVREREPDKAKAQIERSLQRMQTDHLDLLQVHLIRSLEDVEDIGKKGGVYDILQSLKEQGVVKHIGFTGHLSAEAMKKAADQYDFDTMLIALNHHQKGEQKFEQQAVPAAAEKGMGVLVMKVIRPRETVENLNPRNLVRYALSLDFVHSAVIGTDSLKVMKENIELIKKFKPMDEKEMQEIRAVLAPFYRHENLDWMSPGYVDGRLV